MNLKLWAVVAAVMVILTGTGIMMSSNTTNDDKIVIVARANEEGSGLFVKAGVPDLIVRDNVTGEPILDADGKIQYIADNWKGLVLMTPGTQSIQHLMLMDIVQNDLGLAFVDYSGKVNEDAVNIVSNIVPANMASAIRGEIGGVNVDGGIVWESFYSNILATVPGVRGAFTTGETNPDHTCCVVSANRTFAENNSYALVKFLAAYVETVNWIKDALDPSSPNYDVNNYYELVRICKVYTGITNDLVIKDALNNVVYVYDDMNFGLDQLTNDVADLTDGFGGLGVLKQTVQNIGFQDSKAFAGWLVNDWYLKQSQYVNPGSLTDWSNIKVTVLKGDLHGIAITVGKALGIFREYKVNVTIGEQTNGQLAMDDLLSGNTDVAVIGAPPSIIKTINMY